MVKSISYAVLVKCLVKKSFFFPNIKYNDLFTFFYCFLYCNKTRDWQDMRDLIYHFLLSRGHSSVMIMTKKLTKNLLFHRRRRSVFVSSAMLRHTLLNLLVARWSVLYVINYIARNSLWMRRYMNNSGVKNILFVVQKPKK